MAEVEGELVAGGDLAQRVEEAVVAGVLDDDADRPEPVAEALDPLEVGRDPVELARRASFGAKRKPSGTASAQRSNCSSAGSR